MAVGPMGKVASPKLRVNAGTLVDNITNIGYIVSMETWKDIPGIDGYMASSNGLIKNKKTNRISYGWLSTWGYKIATLYVNNKKHGIAIHNLIAIAFLGSIKQGEVVNHKDGNKLNNEIENLEICTVSENNKHAYKTGLKFPTKMFGIKNGMHKDHLN